MTKTLPFEPPSPEPPSSLETAGVVAGGVALVAAAVVLEPVLTVLRLVGALAPESEKPPFDVQAALHDVCAPTEGPARDRRDFVECTRCSAFVPYASMSLNEDGYFCRVCAAALTKQALAENEPTDFDY